MVYIYTTLSLPFISDILFIIILVNVYKKEIAQHSKVITFNYKQSS